VLFQRGRCSCHSCTRLRLIRHRNPAKSGSSPPSGLPDTDTTRRIGIRHAAASGSGKGVNSEVGKARSGNEEVTKCRAHSGPIAFGGGPRRHSDRHVCGNFRDSGRKRCFRPVDFGLDDLQCQYHVVGSGYTRTLDLASARDGPRRSCFTHAPSRKERLGPARHESNSLRTNGPTFTSSSGALQQHRRAAFSP